MNNIDSIIKTIQIKSKNQGQIQRHIKHTWNSSLFFLIFFVFFVFKTINVVNILLLFDFIFLFSISFKIFLCFNSF